MAIDMKADRARRQAFREAMQKPHEDRPHWVRAYLAAQAVNRMLMAIYAAGCGQEKERADG